MESVNFEGIVLSGGGIKGILSLGALHYYYEKGTYNHNDTQIYSGTSVGAAISTLLLCGYTPMEIFMQVYRMHNLFSMSPTITDITNGMGVLPIESFSYKIKELITNKFNYIPTFLELYTQTNKRLIITASNISKMREENYKYDTHTDMSVLLATELSCCLPIVFHRMKYEGDYISDGGLTNNFPVECIDEKKKVLAIITTCNDYGEFDEEFLPYFYKMMFLPIEINNRLKMKLCGPNVTLVKIKHACSIFESYISEDRKMDMFMVGYQAAEYKDQTEYIFVEGM